MTKNLCYLRDVSLTTFNRSCSVFEFTFTIKTKVKKPTQDVIIEVKEVYIQLSFERYKGNLVCVLKVHQYI